MGCLGQGGPCCGQAKWLGCSPTVGGSGVCGPAAHVLESQVEEAGPEGSCTVPRLHDQNLGLLPRTPRGLFRAVTELCMRGLGCLKEDVVSPGSPACSPPGTR